MSGGRDDRARDRAPRIALISATPTAVAPAVAGLAEEFPAAEPWNLLDDRLLTDAPDHGPLPPRLVDRMRRLIGHALAGGADGVLLTCSLYGPVVDGIETPVPLLAPDTAAFAQALALSPESGGVLVLASFEAALRDTTARFSAAAAAAGSAAEPVGAVAPDAFGAARREDPAALFEALRNACAPHRADVVLLAQYSLAPAAAPLSTALGLPVVSGPRAAAVALRSALTGRPV
ncbi:aspartate/glutamate racemase family protein [Streptomyces sp. NPDC014894]|uniref:aspartate/glutamate racemase family protein n=1 Tax=Streptomyces sp. NPDC014894 TaxID=3364931 RepID=UPI0036F4C815